MDNKKIIGILKKIKKDIPNITERIPFIKMIDRVDDIVTNHLGQNKFSKRLQELKPNTLLTKLYDNEQSALQIEIDSIIDNLQFFNQSHNKQKPIPLTENDDLKSTTEKKLNYKNQVNSRLALIVGCSEYKFGGVLQNPVNDANSITETLKSMNFEIITCINPDLKKLKLHIDNFGEKLKKYDTGLFYFAGHGVQVKGMNYLLPIDAKLHNERMVEFECTEVNQILGYMEVAQTSVNILILDACRYNPFAERWHRGWGPKGLTSINAPKGSIIAYATSPGQIAYDGEGSNGLYTSSLLNFIGQEQINILKMFQLVRNEVMKKSNNEQIPWESTSLTDDFYFKPNI